MNIKHILIIFMISATQIRSASSAAAAGSISYQRTEGILGAIRTIIRQDIAGHNASETTKLQIQQFPEKTALCGCRSSKIKVIIVDKLTGSFLAARGIECIECAGACIKNDQRFLYKCCAKIPLDQVTPGDWSRPIEGTPEELARFLLTENKNPQ